MSDEFWVENTESPKYVSMKTYELVIHSKSFSKTFHYQYLCQFTVFLKIKQNKVWIFVHS